MDSNSINTTLVSLEDRSSRKKRKIALIISLIIVFGTIISCIISALIILKHGAESESLLSVAAPGRAIAAVCSLTPYPEPCSRSLQSLHGFKGKITPSLMVYLSVLSAKSQLTIVGSMTKVNAPSLQECKSLVSDSPRLINQSVDATGDDEVFKDLKKVEDMKEWMKLAERNLNKCLEGLGVRVSGDFHSEWMKLKVFGKFHVGRMKTEMLLTRQYVANSYAMLEKNGIILDMFYNPIPLHSVLVNVMLSRSGFDFSMVFFPFQYLVLVFLFCLLLRL